MRLFTTTAIAAVLTLPGVAVAQSGSTGTSRIDAGQVVSLGEWQYQDLYQKGWSAENFIDEMEVYGENGEEIGDVEDLIVGPDGTLLAIVAEVGGFWDMGDTHVSVPWSEVTINEARDGVIVPLTEENVGAYDAFAYSGLEGSALAEQVAMGLDEAEFGNRAFRLSELIGDYARLEDGQDAQVEPPADEQGAVDEEVRPVRAMADYGYVSDVIIQDGRIAATVVDPASAYGPGYYAYPYYGYGYGWEPGSEYYDLPYAEQEVSELGAFDYDEIQSEMGDRETEVE